jgi:hypothetical protein
MRSRLVSLLTVAFYFGKNPDTAVSTQHRWYEPPPTRWYPDIGPVKPEDRTIPPDEYAFTHNLESLIAEAKADGVKVVLVPFCSAPKNKYSPFVRATIAKNEEILKDLAARMGCTFVPFPASVITPEYWTDDCHENAAGALEKATYLAPSVEKVLWP